LVRLLNTEISPARLTLRAMIALLLSALSLAALYYLPEAILGYVSTAAPDAQLQGLTNQLLDARIPPLGILISLLVLATVTLRRTRLEGPLLILLGATLITYSYILLHGGTVDVQIPVTEIQALNTPINIQTHLTLNIATLMLTSMCPPILIIFKGAILTIRSPRKPTASAMGGIGVAESGKRI
jgi:hypothetical protein